MYYDATTALPQEKNALDADSSGSHPLVDAQLLQQMKGSVVSGNMTIMAQGDGSLAAKIGGSQYINSLGGASCIPEPTSPDSTPNLALTPTNSGLALGGCTPGLRRRRQGAEKYVTDLSQLGLRFQRRRRHNAGNFEGEQNQTCTPLMRPPSGHADL